jgi:hypothetical protein
MASMKMKKDTKAKVLKNLKKARAEVDTLFENFIKEIENATTVDKCMELKQYYLEKFVMKMPIYDGTCYFCMLHDNNCDACEYKKYHGECQTGDESARSKEKLPSWDKICRARNRLCEIIREEYYHGERY